MRDDSRGTAARQVRKEEEVVDNDKYVKQMDYSH